MRILVCIKRVPQAGGKLTLTEDKLAIDTKFLGFTIGPHEECAVEEAVRLVEKFGGSATVLTLGHPDSVEQLQFAMSLGVADAILLDNSGAEWGPISTALAIVKVVEEMRSNGDPPDLILFGNEAPDSGDFQVGIRVANALDLPLVTGVKGIEVLDGELVARRESGSTIELTRVSLPAVLTVKEGLNLPRYPSLPGRLKAKSKPIKKESPQEKGDPTKMVQLRLPVEDRTGGVLLGEGPDAVGKIVEVLKELGVVAR